MVGQCAEAEQWGPIAGWEGFYEVSDRGRVRSLDTPPTPSGVDRRTGHGQIPGVT
jgi:NUMOD4 motif